jgi:energy-coupling factor transporter transmembrane protein EcfT
MDMALRIVGIVLWLVGASLAVTWAAGVRIKTARGQGVQLGTATIATFFAISLVVAFLLRSPFHLLWLLPLSFLLGWLPVFHWLGSLYSSVVNVGVDMERARRKNEVLKEFGQMLVNGASEEEAVKAISERYPELVVEIGKEPFMEEAQFVAGIRQMLRSQDPAQGGAG